MRDQPWYKRTAIWILVTGAMIVGAFIAFGGKFKRALRRAPAPPGDREIARQQLEDAIQTIDQQIVELENEPKVIFNSDGKSLADINANLAEARKRRRAKIAAGD